MRLFFYDEETGDRLDPGTGLPPTEREEERQLVEDGCDSCGARGCDTGAIDQCCSRSRRPCGHHCNHSWSHDHCCWCDETWGAS